MIPGIKNILFVGAVLLILVLGAVGFWYWQSRLIEAPPAVTEEASSTTLGAEIFEKSENPIKDEVPETNPFTAETNPFKEVYQNPFE